MVKKEEKAKTVRAKNGRKWGEFGIKLVMINPQKNYDFRGIDKLVC